MGYTTYVEEGWWHPNVKSGQVHDHPERPGRGWSEASHRLCEPVHTKRIAGNDVARIAIEVVDVLAQLRHISDRMARFEDIPQAELDAFDARKRALCERLEPGFYDQIEVGEADVLGDLLAAGKLDGIPYGDEA